MTFSYSDSPSAIAQDRFLHAFEDRGESCTIAMARGPDSVVQLTT
ncbi:hypothetical protein BPODLACK_04128 [Gordonia sp. YY1]|nr:hypothetical protein BPODLACK_04128 [Gordonia sp. YY1]